jgi:hypothetical protein
MENVDFEARVQSKADPIGSVFETSVELGGAHLSANEDADAEFLETLRQLEDAMPYEDRKDFRDLLSGTFVASDAEWEPSEIADDVNRLYERYLLTMSSHEFDLSQYICAGWWTIANHQARAVKELVIQGLASSSVPNIRSAFEHAMALALVARTEENNYAAGVVSSGLLDLIRTAPANTPMNPDLANVIGRMRTEIDGDVIEKWPHFSERLRRLGVKEEFYPHYVKLSIFVHPTISGVVGFSDLSNEKMPTSEANAWFHVMIGDPLLWAVECQCWSALSIDQILDRGLPWRGEVLELCEKYEIPMIETLFGQGPSGE